MKDSNVLWAGAGLIFGTGIGFFVGYYIMGKETAKMYDDEIAQMDQKIKALQDMMPEKNFAESNKKADEKAKLLKPKEPSAPKREKITDYTTYSKKISEVNAEYEQNCIVEKEAEIPTEPDPADSIPPTDEDEDDEFDDNYDEEVALNNNAVQEEMYYEQVREYRNIHGDDILVLEDGDRDPDFPDLQYDHEDLYWFTRDDTITDADGNLIDEEECIGTVLRDQHWLSKNIDSVWVRNNRLEKDYCVYRYTGTAEDFWIKGVGK